MPPLLEMDWSHLPLYHAYGWENMNSPLGDRMSLHAFVGNVTQFAIAHRISGQPRFRERAGLLIRIFLLDENSGMKPNLQYADTCRSAKDNKLRASPTGFLDGAILMLLWDAIKILDSNKDFPEAASAREWASNYLQWLLSVELTSEPYAIMYHGHSWDLQVTAAAAFVGDSVLVRRSIELALLRVLSSLEQKECKHPVCPLALETPTIARKLLQGLHKSTSFPRVGYFHIA